MLDKFKMNKDQWLSSINKINGANDFTKKDIDKVEKMSVIKKITLQRLLNKIIQVIYIIYIW